MNSQDELERMLTRDLQRQVDGFSGVGFGLDDVRGRARRIQRNRRIAAGAAVAAALAVIAPTALTVGTGPRGSDEIQPAPSPTATTDVPVEVARTTLTLADLPRGEAPAVEYFTPDGVVLPGEGVRPTEESLQALVRSEVHGGWLALGPSRDEVRYLSEDLTELDRFPSSGFASTPGRDLVSWTVLEPGSRTLTVRSTTDPDAVASWDLPEGPFVEPAGILGPDSVVYESTTGNGETTVHLAKPDGTTTKLPYLGAEAADPVNGLFSVLTSVEGSSGCFAVVEVATLEPAWETCQYALGSFSPDGRYVMATNADSDGLGPTSIYVLDALSGDLVAEFTSQGRDVVTLVMPAWESEGSIVASAAQGNTQTLVRLGVDGTLEQVADGVDGRDHGDLYYYLGADRAGL